MTSVTSMKVCRLDNEAMRATPRLPLLLCRSLCSIWRRWTRCYCWKLSWCCCTRPETSGSRNALWNRRLKPAPSLL